MNDQERLSEFFPFENINKFYTAAYVYSRFKDLNDEVDIKDIIEKIVKTDLNNNEYVFFRNKMIINLQVNFPSQFFAQIVELDKEILNFNLTHYNSFRINFSKCVTCESQLNLDNMQKFESIVYFASSKPLKCLNLNVTCNKCKTKHFYSYFINQKNQKMFYDDCFIKEFISFSKRTIFDVKLINSLTSDIMYKHTSLYAFCNSHNCNFRNQNLFERGELNVQRTTSSWFYFHLLKYMNEFKSIKEFSAPINIENLDDSLEEIRTSLFTIFTKKWSNLLCRSKDCSKVLIVDGIWKLNRLKCMNEENQLCCAELTPINVGCTKTPNRNGYFCSDHSNDESVQMMNLYFDVNAVKTKFSLSTIRATYIQDNFKNLKIHDVYCEKINKDDGKDDDEDENNINILYLIETSETRKPLCWVKIEALDKKMLSDFNETRLKNTEIDAFEDISCRTNKNFGIPFLNKKRTRGLLISSFNCGIINGYRELFGSESVRQVVLFFFRHDRKE
jgi:hypothetical protein